MLRRAGLDLTSPVRGGLAMMHHGGRGHDDAIPATVGTPAEVQVVAEQRQRRIEPAQLVPCVATHQHARAAHGQDVAHVVVLALVELVPLESRDAVARAGDGDADLDEHLGVAPPAQLRSEDLRTGVPVGGAQQVCESGRRGRGVVVQQPHPLQHVGGHRGTRPGGQPRGHRGTESRVAGRADDSVDETHLHGASKQLGCAVRAPGIHRHHAVGPTGRAGQRRERGRQPPGAVVRDDHRRDVVVAYGHVVVRGVSLIEHRGERRRLGRVARRDHVRGALGQRQVGGVRRQLLGGDRLGRGRLGGDRLARCGLVRRRWARAGRRLRCRLGVRRTVAPGGAEPGQVCRAQRTTCGERPVELVSAVPDRGRWGLRTPSAGGGGSAGHDPRTLDDISGLSRPPTTPADRDVDGTPPHLAHVAARWRSVRRLPS